MFGVYAPMLGVPVLMYLYLILRILHAREASVVSLAIISAGMLVFGAVSFSDIYMIKRKPPMFVRLTEKAAERPHLSANPPETSSSRGATMTVKRYDPASRTMVPSQYSVSLDKYTTVLDALIQIKRTTDHTISIRYSCRMGICGSCSMVINGRPMLACQTNLLSNLKGNSIEIEPMRGHPLLKDLVCDFDDFFTRHVSVIPRIIRKDEKEKFEAPKEYIQTVDELKEYLPFSYCIMCGLCVDSCPVVNTNPMFIGPQALSQVLRYYSDSRDQMGEERLKMSDRLTHVWDCEFAQACSLVCPQGVDPAYAIQSLKAKIVRQDLGLKR